jgi:hypothetical protein
MRGGFAIVVCALLAGPACDAKTGETAEPAQPSASASVATTPSPTAAPAAAPAATAASRAPAGWWRGESVCLELFVNGDFELALLRDPKVLVMGRAQVTVREGGASTADLSVERIWRARFTGPCMKVHELGDWIDDAQALGTRFTKSAVTKLQLKQVSDDELEVCGETCETLKRDKPQIGGRWRVAGLENPNRPPGPYTRGDMLELDFGRNGWSRLWAAKTESTFADVVGSAKAESLGDDRFAISFTPGEDADTSAGDVLDRALKRGTAIHFTARRMPGEKLEICAIERCATLERQLDAYDHDIR